MAGDQGQVVGLLRKGQGFLRFAPADLGESQMIMCAGRSRVERQGGGEARSALAQIALPQQCDSQVAVRLTMVGFEPQLFRRCWPSSEIKWRSPPKGQGFGIGTLEEAKADAWSFPSRQ